MIFDEDFEKDSVSDASAINNDAAGQLADVLGSFILEMNDLAENDDGLDIVIENSFNTIECDWSDINNAAGELGFGNDLNSDLPRNETRYRIEERQEFDPVMTALLTEMDGWPHYDTKTVEYLVPMEENEDE